MRAADLDLFEQTDVWHKFAERRGVNDTSSTAPPHLFDAMRQLMTYDATALARSGRPLHRHADWVEAFADVGAALMNLNIHGALTRGLRAVIAHHLVFHGNRAGLTGRDQQAMALLARDVVMTFRTRTIQHTVHRKEAHEQH